MTKTDLPGADLIEKGLSDLTAAVMSDEALLVSIGAPRLRALGIAVPAPLEEPEMALYCALALRYGDGAHSRYNALIRALVSTSPGSGTGRSW